jgi:Na+/H+ antiporter NhaD/arsenite permease-like protein
MMPLSTAMIQSGAAAMMAEMLVRVVGNAGPYALLAGLFVLTSILGQLISNTATALIIIPIAVTAATGMGISPRPVLMSVAVAAAAAFLTPVATPVNLMVKAPGGVRIRRLRETGLAPAPVVLPGGNVSSPGLLAVLIHRMKRDYEQRSGIQALNPLDDWLRSSREPPARSGVNGPGPGRTKRAGI